MHGSESLCITLPSWVPRWEHLKTASDDRFWEYISVPLKGSEHPSQVEIILGKILKVRKVVLDDLCFVSDVF